MSHLNNQNNLTRMFQQQMNMPIQYMNNQMLNNNPIYTSNIYDPTFYQQMRLMREEQMRKIKNVSDLGLTKEQITDYVICPIKVEKSSKQEIEKFMSDGEAEMTKKFLEQLWRERTNAPYKNILKDEDTTNKHFKSEKDLIVYTINESDKDRAVLMADY